MLGGKKVSGELLRQQLGGSCRSRLVSRSRHPAPKTGSSWGQQQKNVQEGQEQEKEQEQEGQEQVGKQAGTQLLKQVPTGDSSRKCAGEMTVSHLGLRVD